jgi:cytochrome b
MTDGENFGLLEKTERRKQREPIIKVWDLVVRSGHWLMVIFFAIIYLRYRKFPIHAYAGYLMLLLVILRIVWGMIGSRAARFTTFWFSPAEVLDYSRRAMHGGAGYYVSHNPMGSWMVYTLLSLMLVNGILGLMLYSSGQELGPLGEMVSPDWEDTLKGLHKTLGHITAAFVAMHIAGVLWAARAHRENYVLAMFTGHKRIPRHAQPGEIDGYRKYSEESIPLKLRGAERWFNYRHPFMGSLLLVVAVILVALELTEAAVNLNKHLLAY